MVDLIGCLIRGGIIQRKDVDVEDVIGQGDQEDGGGEASADRLGGGFTWSWPRTRVNIRSPPPVILEAGWP